MSREILLLVDALAREKNVEKDVVFAALEQAPAGAAPGARGDRVHLPEVSRRAAATDGRVSRLAPVTARCY